MSSGDHARLTEAKPMTIYVSARSVFGEIKLYPACRKADLFCQLAGTKTVTDSILDTVRKLGYSVVESQ